MFRVFLAVLAVWFGSCWCRAWCVVVARASKIAVEDGLRAWWPSSLMRNCARTDTALSVTRSTYHQIRNIREKLASYSHSNNHYRYMKPFVFTLRRLGAMCPVCFGHRGRPRLRSRPYLWSARLSESSTLALKNHEGASRNCLITSVSCAGI